MSNENTKKELTELGKRIPHGGYKVIAKRAKVSYSYFQKFMDGMYSLDTPKSHRIIATISGYLKEVTDDRKDTVSIISKMNDQYPVVKPTHDIFTEQKF